jgi:hypothetical protein
MLELTAWSSAEETFWIYLMKLPAGSYLLKLSSGATFLSYLMELTEGDADWVIWIYLLELCISWSYLSELLELSLCYLS